MTYLSKNIFWSYNFEAYFMIVLFKKYSCFFEKSLLTTISSTIRLFLRILINLVKACQLVFEDDICNIILAMNLDKIGSNSFYSMSSHKVLTTI